MSYDGIIFDMDGTLWDSRVGVVTSWNEIFEQEGECHRTSLEQMTDCMGLPMDEIATRVIPDKPYCETAALFEKCFSNENQWLSKHGGMLYPKLEETLARLQTKYPLYIVSNCQSGYIESMFEAHGLAKYFADIECFGNNNLPKSENIRLIATRNHLTNPVYVGDTAMDAEATKAAGFDFIWARYGFGRVENPTYVIDTFEELLTIMNVG